ncbi:MAG: hypothetical protein GY822_09215, partial [Deltaproteobacteria bacterium]|nr:hypothetical protein [Deltaproteobacteria bacterium]
IVSGGQAAVDAWKAGMSTGGPYAPIVAAAYTAASLAKTGAMISSIKGGSKPSAGGGSLPSVSTPTAAPVAQAQQEPTRRVHIDVAGESMFSDGAVVKLVETINSKVGDGLVLTATATVGG